MSIISPDSEIKDSNLDDLYIKYRNRIIESVGGAKVKDLEVYGEKLIFRIDNFLL